MRFSLAPSLALRPWAPLLFSSCSRSSLARATVPALYPSGQCLSWLWQSPKALHSFVKPAPHQRTPLSDIKFYCVLFWCCPGRLFSWCRPGAVIPLRASSEHIALAGHGGLGSPGSPDRRARCDGGVLAARFMAFADGRGGGVSLCQIQLSARLLSLLGAIGLPVCRGDLRHGIFAIVHLFSSAVPPSSFPFATYLLL